MNTDLATFIAHARDRGMDHATIRMLLLSAGWKERDVARALSAQALDIPVPAPPDTGGAREAFLHLLAFSGLYAWVIAVVMLLFGYVDHHLPDASRSEIPAAAVLSGLRWSLAVVLVAFPVFLAVTRLTLVEIARNPEKSRSAIRRWLTYLTLLVSALALGGDVIALVFRLLEGELTLRFLIKVGVVLLVAGAVFVYYLLSVGDAAGGVRPPGLHRRFALAATVLVAVTVGWGLVLAGSPGEERLRRMDERRLTELRTIRREIELLCVETAPSTQGMSRTLKRPLPRDLDEVVRTARHRRPDTRDPATGEAYVYEPLGGARYRLCATFDRPRDDRLEPRWNHPGGPHCFELDALEPESPRWEGEVP